MMGMDYTYVRPYNINDNGRTGTEKWICKIE